MTEKRYTIKPQDDLFGVVDNYSADKVCVINGIRTEIEAKWLCKDMNALNDENEELKQVLGSILIEVRRDISATNHSGEVKAFVNPNSFDLISDVLKKYGALKGWYE